MSLYKPTAQSSYCNNSDHAQKQISEFLVSLGKLDPEGVLEVI